MSPPKNHIETTTEVHPSIPTLLNNLFINNLNMYISDKKVIIKPVFNI